MTRSARATCPVCGVDLPVGSLRGHVASERCVVRWARDGRDYAHAHGPRIFELVRDLERALAAYRQAKETP